MRPLPPSRPISIRAEAEPIKSAVKLIFNKGNLPVRQSAVTAPFIMRRALSRQIKRHKP